MLVHWQFMTDSRMNPELLSAIKRSLKSISNAQSSAEHKMSAELCNYLLSVDLFRLYGQIKPFVKFNKIECKIYAKRCF